MSQHTFTSRANGGLIPYKPYSLCSRGQNKFGQHDTRPKYNNLKTSGASLSGDRYKLTRGGVLRRGFSKSWSGKSERRQVIRWRREDRQAAARVTE